MFPSPKYVLVACQPKSASTYLTRSLANLPGCRTASFVPGYDRREQEICETRLKRYRFRWNKAIIAQHHVRYSKPTAKLIDKYNIATVVLFRCYYDSIISIRDHIRNESVISPMGYLDETHCKLPNEELEDMIARIMIPWYIDFYMTWRETKGVCFVNYDELIGKPLETQKRVVEFTGLEFSDETIRHAFSLPKGKETRLNKGVSGRGQNLSKQTKQYVIDLLNLYPKSHKDPFIAKMLSNET